MFKIIKETAWESKTTGNKGTTFVVAYKGRAFVINGEDFPNLKVDTTKKTLVLGEQPVCVKESYTDITTGEVKTGLRLKPSLDIAGAEF